MARSAGVNVGLRRPEGATVAQIAEATGWQPHTVRGFFAGLKTRQGVAVEVLDRVRQVGPNKQGSKGSYSIYRIADAGRPAPRHHTVLLGPALSHLGPRSRGRAAWDLRNTAS
jgi:hypothetical protein